MKYSFTILITLVLMLTGCEDYLDRKDENSDFLTEEEVWRDRNKIQTIAYRLYDCTGYWFETRNDWTGRHPAESGKNYGNVCQFSGEVIFTRSLQANDRVLRGDWWEAVNTTNFANPDFFNSWIDMWEAIYVANSILHKIDDVTPDVMKVEEKNQIKGEAYLFRALGYHEISKRWGPMPYFKVKIFPDTDLNIERPTFLEQINDIVADCDSALMYLPKVGYLNDPVMMGRIGKAAAMGLKSRALTTAASPNYTPGNVSDAALWERAAIAAWELIQLSGSSDQVGLYQGEYGHIFHTEPGTIEGVWPRYFPASRPGIYNLSWLWQNVGANSGGLSPTQEMVDMFETADGWPITHPSSGYTDQDPYVNRDPRFYKDILYHGSTWSKTAENQAMDLRTQPLGEDRSTPNGADFGNSKTGYLVKKLLPDRWNPTKYNDFKFVNAPYIRMAEIYLNYAEAVNEAYNNPQAMAPGADLSAVDALNTVRNRVGHVNVRPEFTTDYLSFQERVRNEFQVELCFEYHIWFDLLRWRIAHEKLHNYNFQGMRIIEDPSAPTGLRFERFEIPWERRFEERQYRYPLPQADLELFEIPKIQQNPGW